MSRKAADTQKKLAAAAFSTKARCIDSSANPAYRVVKEWVEKGEVYDVVNLVLTRQGLMVEVAKNGRKVMPFSNTGLLLAARFSIMTLCNN